MWKKATFCIADGASKAMHEAKEATQPWIRFRIKVLYSTQNHNLIFIATIFLLSVFNYCGWECIKEVLHFHSKYVANNSYCGFLSHGAYLMIISVNMFMATTVTAEWLQCGNLWTPCPLVAPQHAQNSSVT